MRLKERVEELEETVELLANLCHKQTEIIEKSDKDFNEMVELCSKIDKRLDKQEETIKALVELCQPLIAERMETTLGDIFKEMDKDIEQFNDIFCKTFGTVKECKKCDCEKTTKKATTKKTNKKESK